MGLLTLIISLNCLGIILELIGIAHSLERIGDKLDEICSKL